ncbi:MAG: GTPase domain-containing protein [Aliarcobacter sp.]|jgi:GTP-binding protein EngB required for normal cell division|nr:GTPase domain-containing protein [Aliarcobacter sp.]
MNYEQLLLGDNNIKCNMLLIGKTGSGKSSFANYLFGTDKFSASSGKPVTNWENNFQFNSIDISGIKVNIFDSVGLEADNHKNWENELYKFLENKQINNSPNEHIHTFFYVVNAASARIEENELNILTNIQKKFKLSAAIILTNSDMATNEQIENLEKIIKEKNLKFIRVCSIAKKTRAGKETKTFGKEEALEILLSSSFDKIGRDLSLVCLEKVKERLLLVENDLLINPWFFDIPFVKIISKILTPKYSAITFIKDVINAKEELNQTLQNLEQASLSVRSSVKNILNTDEIKKMIPLQYFYYVKFLESFNTNYYGQSFVNKIITIHIDLDKIINQTDSWNDLLEVKKEILNDNLLQNIKGRVKMAYSSLDEKDISKKFLKEIFEGIYKEIDLLKNNIE